MASRTILITGGAGMLATDLAAYLNTQPNTRVISLPHEDMDVTQREEVEAVFAAYQPHVVINTAALHVDDCEINPSKAFLINAWGARILARACQQHRSVLVQISTGGLFGDEVRAYHEYDPVVLKTIYARSKYAGEEYVRQYCERHFVLRLGWLYGGDVTHRENFVVARYREALQKPIVYSANDKYGSPTYTGDVARAISDLLASQEYGLYHLANQGGGTRADYVRHILQEFGIDTPVEEVDSSYFPRKAQVPNCEILTSYNLSYAGLSLLPPWQEALARYIHTIREQLT